MDPMQLVLTIVAALAAVIVAVAAPGVIRDRMRDIRARRFRVHMGPVSADGRSVQVLIHVDLRAYRRAMKRAVRRMRRLARAADRASVSMQRFGEAMTLPRRGVAGK